MKFTRLLWSGMIDERIPRDAGLASTRADLRALRYVRLQRDEERRVAFRIKYRGRTKETVERH